jgi:acyl carrier protein
MDEARALTIIQETFDGLHRSALISAPVQVNGRTVLLGAGSPLDSLAFVTFIADLEDRLSRETGREVTVILTDLHDFKADAPYLDAATMSRYIARVTNHN